METSVNPLKRKEEEKTDTSLRVQAIGDSDDANETH